MRTFSGLVCGIVAAAGCLFTMSQQGQKIAIDEPNDLGVTSLQLDRLDENGNDVFLLRGVSAIGEERASVKLTRGEIAGLAKLLPGDGDTGAAIELTADGTASRVLTRETEHFRIESGQLANPAVLQFLRLRAVATTLEREAKIVVAATSAVAVDQPYGTTYCRAQDLLVTPTAYECCEYTQDSGGSGAHITMFHRADEYVSVRYQNPNGPGVACRASDGVGACSGTACYYGPNGFSAPELYQVPTSHYAYIHPTQGSNAISAGSCTFEWSTNNPTPIYSDATGSIPRGQTCPGGNQGPIWDY